MVVEFVFLIVFIGFIVLTVFDVAVEAPAAGVDVADVTVVTGWRTWVVVIVVVYGEVAWRVVQRLTGLRDGVGGVERRGVGGEEVAISKDERGWGWLSSPWAGGGRRG